jgi:ABC-type lipoprotein release transport system permease subunit
MGVLLKLAFRNLLRQRRRTIITSIAIAGGLFILILFSVLGDGAHREMVQTTIGMMSGNVVVQDTGYLADPALKRRIERVADVVTALEATFPDQMVLARTFAPGLLTSPSGSVGITLFAVQPAREAKVSKLDDKLTDGTWLSGDIYDIVLGATLAESLGVGLGEKVVFMVQIGNELESRLFRVKGVFRTGADEFDGFIAAVDLEAMRAMTGAADSASQVSVIFAEELDVASARDRAKAAIDRDDVAVLTWMEANPALYEYIVVDDLGMWVMMLLIALIAAIGVLNTMLMSVLERTHELGVLLALGLSKGKLALMIFFEALLLGIFSAALGVIAGVAVGQIWVVNGLDATALMGGESMTVAGAPMDLVIHGYLDGPKTALFAGITIFITVLSGLYPVWWTTRLTPVGAMSRR